MYSIFDHLVFDSAKKKGEMCNKSTWKTTRKIWKLVVRCFKCGSNNVFSIANQVRSADEGTSAFNECREFHNKWWDGWQL